MRQTATELLSLVSRSVNASVGGADLLNNTSGATFLAETDSVAGITVSEFETINTSALSLTSAADTFEVTASGSGTFEGSSFTGLSTVDGLVGDDILISSEGVSLTGTDNQALTGDITLSNFDVLDSSITTLTGSDLADSFILSGANTGTANGLSFTDLDTVIAGAGEDSVASAGPINVTAANAATLSDIDFTGIEI